MTIIKSILGCRPNRPAYRVWGPRAASLGAFGWYRQPKSCGENWISHIDFGSVHRIIYFFLAFRKYLCPRSILKAKYSLEMLFALCYQVPETVPSTETYLLTSSPSRVFRLLWKHEVRLRFFSFVQNIHGG